MKSKPAPSNASDTLRRQLATTLEQLDAWRENESAALGQVHAGKAQLADLQRGAAASDAATLARKSAAVRKQIEEANAALQDAREISDRLESEAEALRRQLLDVETIEGRQRAAQAVADLAKRAAPVERAAADLIAALGTLRAEAGNARMLVESAMQDLCPEPMILADYAEIVFPRAGTSGPEASAAVAALLYRIAEASGAKLDGFLAFNEYNRGTGSLTEALRAGASVIASRLGVQP